MHFSSDVSEDGVRERRFDLEVASESVPGLLWTPREPAGTRSLVLFGHGGTQHKRSDHILAMARELVRSRGYAALALDAPRHGERRTAEDLARQRELLRNFSGSLPPLSPEQLRASRAMVPQAVREWRAALQAVQSLADVGTGPVGYWGLSMGCTIGIPLIAEEPRITAAILGLGALRPGDEALAQAAARVTVPVRFMFQLDDELMTPEGGLALFAALGSTIKTMHINPGRHIAIPAHEREDYAAFWTRHLETPEAGRAHV